MSDQAATERSAMPSPVDGYSIVLAFHPKSSSIAAKLDSARATIEGGMSRLVGSRQPSLRQPSSLICLIAMLDEVTPCALPMKLAVPLAIKAPLFRDVSCTCTRQAGESGW